MSEMPRAAWLTLLLALGRCVEFGPCELSVELDSATYRVRFDLGDEPRSVASDLVARLPDSAHLASFELQLDTLLAVLDRQRQPEGRARGVAGV